MDITILACGDQMNFDDIQAALAFIRFLAHNITADQFIAAMHALVPSPDAVDNAKGIINDCMGQGA